MEMCVLGMDVKKLESVVERIGWGKKNWHNIIERKGAIETQDTQWPVPVDIFQEVFVTYNVHT